MEEPPVIPAEPVAVRKTALGRIGLYFSLAAVGAMLAMWLAKPG